ncbi:MAG: 1-acyl-sn-glycerol-3-phosphate acyltransferase [Gemmatimonadetes bacterium]|nr:1-acyl-sn-glycerol-3-phosphate acyltransferase [Gemmatimonadota bacterium]MBT8405270.1 1-acyl-sn-glycerol-3-phosphate acyltransferase [Gemmatimonadota bacterium]NNF38221.1 1-acyl-sn-glycerol-3-phosphate acyltransferase [Gemmatimonadota bacterium]NNK62562.1 1-acyl-sn-glycerol-3-phosphate acyltransferase [Gemmatimonadota bacterium]
MIRLLNTLRVYLLGFASTAYHAAIIVGSTTFKTRNAERICFQAPRNWCRSLLWSAGVRVELEGLEHLDPPRPAVLVCNHESWYDVFALAGKLPVDYRFVGKKELARIPLFGPAWIASGHIPIDRSNRKAAIQSLRRAGEIMRRDNAVVVMFPEGTRSADGTLLPFKKGAFVLALETGVPVIPIGVSGGRRIMPKGSLLVRPGTMRVHIGAPIEVDGLTVQDRDQLVERARVAVERLRADASMVTDGSDQTRI